MKPRDTSAKRRPHGPWNDQHVLPFCASRSWLSVPNGSDGIRSNPWTASKLIASITPVLFKQTLSDIGSQPKLLIEFACRAHKQSNLAQPQRIVLSCLHHFSAAGVRFCSTSLQSVRKQVHVKSNTTTRSCPSATHGYIPQFACTAAAIVYPIEQKAARDWCRREIQLSHRVQKTPRNCRLSRLLILRQRNKLTSHSSFHRTKLQQR